MDTGPRRRAENANIESRSTDLKRGRIHFEDINEVIRQDDEVIVS